MSKAVHYGYKQALEKGLVKEGAIVISYPDRTGKHHRGVVEQVVNNALHYDKYMVVKYEGEMVDSTTIDYSTGRMECDYETNLDIMLIEI